MASTAVRNVSRGIIQSISSSCHHHRTFTKCAVAQGNIIVVRTQFTYTSLPSSSSSSLPSRLCVYAAGKPSESFSSYSASAITTASHRRPTTTNRQFLVMAAASPIFPNQHFSTAALQPQVDALDETVDPVQRQLLEEQCIVLDNKDQVIGHDTKRNCHKIVNGDVLLHRAFSVFLFNGRGELLLQQRSKTKITFPLMWTNTCCSHPLYTPSEMEEKDAIGVRRAARRRLEIELGIPQDSISLDDFQYLTRIHYKALSNSVWGEHEIDYILFLQKDDLQIQPNPEEIQEIRWVTLDKVKEMRAKENVTLTPWFDLILNSNLPVWWENLESLKQFQDHEKINRM